MSTLPVSSSEAEVAAVRADVIGDELRLELSDGRTVAVNMSRLPWLRWLATATNEQRQNWAVEPGGFAVFWPDLDDGVEVRRLLSLAPLV